MKFFFDENLSPQHAARLRDQGHDAVAIAEVNLGGADEGTVRAFAIREMRTLVTLDADFGNILRFPVEDTPGVIWLRLHPPLESKIREAIARCLALVRMEDLRVNSSSLMKTKFGSAERAKLRSASGA